MKKTGVIIGAVLAAAAAAVIVCVVLTGRQDETYRSIMVYQVNGNATITRERIGEMAAYENLMLQSGDTAEVASDSSMRLKLDDDKYLLAEQNTLINITADGDDENARTYIDLQRGSVTSEIQNKLKSGASYEVNTPNSIMAVRGTIFRVEVAPKENGDLDTKLSVFQGTVGVRPVMADGTVSDEEMMVEAGQELMVEGMLTEGGHLSDPAEIDYESLPPVIGDYLEKLEQNGQKPAANASKVQNQQEADRRQEEQDRQEAEQPNTEDPSELEQEQEEQEVKVQDQPENKRLKTKQQAGESETQEKAEDPSESGQEDTQPQSEEMPQQDTQLSKTEPQPSVQNPPPGAGDDSGKQSGGGSKKKKTQYYTVTFQYNGSIFGTQSVKKGEPAAEPKLTPTQNGSWDYDFSKKVNKNIVVEWKENE